MQGNGRAGDRATPPVGQPTAAHAGVKTVNTLTMGELRGGRSIRDAVKGIRFTGVTGDRTCFNAARDAQLPGFVIEIKNLTWNLYDQHPADPCPEG